MAGGTRNGGRTKWGWNIHPGEILREEFQKPMGLSVYQLARQIHITRSRVNDIARERRGARLTPHCGWRGSLTRPRSSG